SRFSIDNQPQEVQDQIRMPVLEQQDPGLFDLGSITVEEAERIARQASRTGSAQPDAKPAEAEETAQERAERLASEISQDAVRRALGEIEQPDEQAFAVVRNTQTGDVVLVDRATLENAPEGTFEVITPNVSEREARSIMDAGLLQGGDRTIMGPEEGRELAMPDAAYGRLLDDARLRRMQRELAQVEPQEDRVVEIDGKLYPLGTEDPTQYTLDNVANAPTPAGYGWVGDADGDQPYLGNYERDDTGQLRVPEGTLLVGGNVRASTNPFDGPDWLERFAENPNDVLGEWASGGWDWLTGAISGGWD